MPTTPPEIFPPDDDTASREAWVERVEHRFTPIASALGLLFVLVVIGENLARDESPLREILLIAGWAIWAVFLAEFVLRAAVAPSKRRFFKRNWWQLIFLVLPFLRFIAALRLARVARVTRAGRIVGSAVRGTRSAGQVLRGRITWLFTIHAVVVLSASQLLFEFAAGGETYGSVLYRVAMTTASGQTLGLGPGLSQVMDVVLALYSVVVFASAAGALGAYYVQRREPQPAEVETG